ncbi:MAG: branched-chain amino acid ABC transporter ATP-binding protein [Chloroflexi bacterium]|nr:MAG: branched-chain amino acid ABC transporter ATP-binding protein [Chloroflexota bacterium]
MLQVNNLQAGYGGLQVLWDVSLSVSEGEFVALIGPNGAGKTTTLRTIAGLVKPRSGGVTFMGRPVDGLPAYQISRLGISFVTEELDLFESMSVRENLLLGAYTIQDRRKKQDSLDRVLQLFPRLGEREKQLAGTLSGGERKMLAIGRGLMSDPRLLLVDEPSLGLAPKLVLSVYEALLELHRRGVTILLVEQNVNTTLHIVDRGYVMEQGKIVLQGTSAELLADAYLQDTYMGTDVSLV